MARPKVTHDGFLIPNAADVSSPRMAEPDRVDFNTLSSLRWGVVEGCLVTCVNAQVTVNPGLALVNGVMVTVTGGQINVGSGGSQDRFDIIGVDDGGNPVLVAGTAGVDPVFPDPPANVTTLAAVFAPATGTD